MKSHQLLAMARVFVAVVVAQLLLAACNSQSSSTPAQQPPANVRVFTGLPLDENGWTNFAALLQSGGYEEARVIFISSSAGDDSTGEVYGVDDLTFDENGMFQPAGAVQAFLTIAAGYELIRDGYPFIEGLQGSLDPKIYAINGNGLLLEENVFYSPVEKNRHLYMSPAGNEDSSSLRGLVIRGNLFFESRRGGPNLRSGALLENNTIIRNDNTRIGGAGGSRDSIQSGTVRHNVFIEGSGTDSSSLSLVNNDGTEVYGNIWTDATGLASSTMAVIISGDTDVHIARNINIYDNIIYGWASGGSHRAFDISASFTEVEEVRIQNNDFQMVTGATEIIRHRAYDDNAKLFEGFAYGDNRYYSPDATGTWFRVIGGGDYMAIEDWRTVSGETEAQAIQVDYPDPGRNLRTYSQSLGGNPSTDEFMLETLLQSRHHWRPQYTACAFNNYIREGFGKEPSGICFVRGEI